MKKKNIALLSATLLTMNLFVSTTDVFAKNAQFTSKTTDTSKINVKSVEYSLDKYDQSIELDFTGKIKLKSNAKVSVKDSTGKNYTAHIDEHDSNEIDLDVMNLKAGKNYTVTIRGIRKAKASSYGTLNVKFNIPKANKSLIKEVEYDHDDRELSIEFSKKVTYKNPKVTITNTNNTKTYKASIIEKENDELTLRISGLKVGQKYNYKITGISANGSDYNKAYTGTFSATY